MRREELVRDDFPPVDRGFDPDSVAAHLNAVAAHVAALEARIAALETERERMREQLGRPAAEPVAEPAPETAAPAASSSEDEVAARLFATRLAMDGKDRDTIVLQLAAGHEIDDPGALVDDVLARLT